MALKESAYSAELKSACESAIKQPGLREQAPASRRGKRSAPAPSTSATTFPVYVLGLRALIKGRGVADAKLVGYQMLTSYEGGAAVAAEVPRYGKGASRTTGPAADAALEAYRKVQKLKEIEASAYEPRILRIPALRIEAFWLNASGKVGHDKDWVVPYHTYFQELLRKSLVPLPKFLSSLKPFAQRELERARPED